MLGYESPMFISFDNIDLSVISPESCTGGGTGSSCSGGSVGITCTSATNAGVNCSGYGTTGVSCSGGSASVECTNAGEAGISCKRGSTGSSDTD